MQLLRGQHWWRQVVTYIETLIQCSFQAYPVLLIWTVQDKRVGLGWNSVIGDIRPGCHTSERQVVVVCWEDVCGSLTFISRLVAGFASRSSSSQICHIVSGVFIRAAIRRDTQREVGGGRGGRMRSSKRIGSSGCRASSQLQQQRYVIATVEIWALPFPVPS